MGTLIARGQHLRWRFLAHASSCCCWRPCALVCVEFVKVKMLPFDNKSEFQVIVDMPEGTTLEQTARGDASAGRCDSESA